MLLLLLAAACTAPEPRHKDDPSQFGQRPATAPASEEADALCRVLEAGDAPILGISEVKGKALRAFYRARNCAPLWFHGGVLTPGGYALVDRLRAVEPTDPAFGSARPAAEAVSSGPRPPQEVARVDLLLTAGFAALAVDPADPSATPADARVLALAASAANDTQSLQRAVPANPQIRGLRSALGAHRDMSAAGGWPRVPDGPKIALGAHGPRVAALRERLQASGDVEQTVGDPALFDAMLEDGLRHFQARHGLQVDGVAARETLSALNVPVAARIALLAANLSRQYGEQRDWGPRYVAVNIAAATVTLVEDGRPIVERRAIVGRPTWPTPQLDSIIDHVEFHPSWTVPARIAALELLPKIRKDKSYLRRNHMRIENGQIRQAPGPDNPLGQVKFVFANPYSVYLHDTNAPGLFERAQRFLSHGCIRVEQAVDLARRLLQDDPAWPPSRIDAVLAGGQTERADLSRPIPVHLVYDTAWVDERGVVNFRPDAYSLDPSVIALRTAAGPRGENNCGS